jgi:hypothetical protein
MQRYSIQVKPAFRQILFIFLLVDVLINILSFWMPFFWDNILTATIAQYFFNTGNTGWIPPLQWDAGHPPFFALYLSSLWAILGKSLWVSHLAMFPFLWLKTWSLWSIAVQLKFSERHTTRTLFFCLLCPAILTQSILISYDMVMLAGFLLGLSGILSKTKWQIITGALLLVAMSLRGLQWVFVLMVLQYLYLSNGSYRKPKIGSLLATYALPLLAIASWYFYHYLQAGWAIFSPSPSWAGHREWSGFSAFFHKGFALLRAIADQGMIALWAGMVLVVLFNKKNTPTLRFLVAGVLVAFVGGLLPLLVFSSPILPRYGLPLMVLLVLVVCGSDLPYRKWVLTAIAIVMFSGHAWVFQRFSNSWETTIAHVPYHAARKQTLQYLGENNISPASTATHFPLYTSQWQTNLKGDTIRLRNLHGREIKEFEYVLKSNIHNDFNRQTKREISSWEEVMTFRKWWIYIRLYQRPALQGEE